MTDRKWPAEFMADAKAYGTGRVLGQMHDPTAAEDCGNCGGTGSMYAFYVKGGPYKSPPSDGTAHFFENAWYTGEMKAAPCPVCQGSSKMNWLAKVCGLYGDELDLSFSDFREMKGKESARQTAAELLSSAPRPVGFVTFYGDYGRGKSHLLKALVNGFRLTGTVSVYTRAADLLADVRDGFSDNAQGAAEALIGRFRNCRVLAVDEIDRFNMTPWAQETIFRVLDYRYEGRDASLTLLATNKHPGELPAELQYLSSRMKGGTLVEIGGIDMRPAIGAAVRAR